VGLTNLFRGKRKKMLTFAAEMMILNVFNPEHDLALASGLSNFTAPHAGRQLHADLDWLPAIWAQPGDIVLVDSAEAAQRAFGRLMHRSFDGFVVKSQLSRLDISRVDPWGWDEPLRRFLLRWGVSPQACLTESEVAAVRELSHRRTAVCLLPQLRLEGTVGESRPADSGDAVRALADKWGRVVVKAPWSSSGKGLMPASAPNAEGWYRRILRQQGSVVVEQRLQRLADFALLFRLDGQGGVEYRGLSLFMTNETGAYTGNWLAPEGEKFGWLMQYLPPQPLVEVRRWWEQYLTRFRYRGPVGIDMMLCPDGLCPCIEINWRMTMGHVAQALTEQGHAGKLLVHYIYGQYCAEVEAFQ
jgi:hypothetical protein